jgi:acetyl esterase/lipase
MASQQLQVIIDMLKERARLRQENPPSLEEMRASLDEMGSTFTNLNGVETEPTVANGVPAEWVVATEAHADRVMLYLHGGGYVIGSIVSHRGLAANLSRATQSRVLLIDYRLAPEHPFPAAVEDAVSAYRWLIAHGTDAARLTVAGDSAGGGLTVATLVALRKADDPLPAAGVCISPWVDLEGIGESMTTRASIDPMVQREDLIDMAKLYLGDAAPRTPLAAPLYADLAGLPPLFVQVGTAETLFDDATRLTTRATQAGVEVVLEPWEEMIHVWPIFAPMLPEAQKAITRIGEYVQQHIGTGATPV